ncbi:penicillin acylase family protein [Blastopirellula retiformator]|uniref:Glutaryl-7-aminocephalosporanic-acid acylase n=1 Tax=Blastopirellula retiformator TaxID=2527970 RepID=A0A5C5VJY1_9BACT|nr:penicillin acylase family protein [Blastopirellula retiformator]TWT38918.1 Glutaryl-7-aminocephalosporanic-acid acylase precursor [Blastopirellula retiformator]
MAVFWRRKLELFQSLLHKQEGLQTRNNIDSFLAISGHHPDLADVEKKLNKETHKRISELGPSESLVLDEIPLDEVPIDTPLPQVDVSPPSKTSNTYACEILWDHFGVPHVYSESPTSLFFAFGWCQAHSHGDLLLELYGRSRGRNAEYWGAGEDDWRITTDRHIRQLDVVGNATRWYNSLFRDIRENLEAFCDGINHYADKYADRLSERVRQVLPVTPVDVLAHLQNAIHYHFVFRPELLSFGSNAWAVAPSRTKHGNSLLLINPHTPWSDSYTWYEAHLTAEEAGIDCYGATLVGLPFLSVGFNKFLGWAHTVNTMDGADLYALKPVSGGYAWDNEAGFLPWDESRHTIKVRESDGSFREESYTVRRSIHGPVIIEDPDLPIALRVVGTDQPYVINQYWDMMRSRDITEFENAVQHLQNPTFMILYADRDGKILSSFSGQVPKKPVNDWAFWGGVVPGNSSKFLWTETYDFADLPHVVNPPSGWLQNANDPPWNTTIPGGPSSEEFPLHLAPNFMHLRAQYSALALKENDNLTLEDFVKLKHNTRVELAERVLEDLIVAARNVNSPLLKSAANVLENWDRRVESHSRGAVLFKRWAQLMPWDSDGFAVPWDPNRPLETPKGLRSPEVAMVALESASLDLINTYKDIADTCPKSLDLEEPHYALAIKWGTVHRLRVGSFDHPASGGGENLGVFRTIEFRPIGGDNAGRFEAVSGECFVAAIEFGDRVRAKVVLGYGNSSQRGSKHVGDQLALLAANQLRDALLTRADVEANLQHREVLSLNAGQSAGKANVQDMFVSALLSHLSSSDLLSLNEEERDCMIAILSGEVRTNSDIHELLRDCALETLSELS